MKKGKCSRRKDGGDGGDGGGGLWRVYSGAALGRMSHRRYHGCERDGFYVVRRRGNDSGRGGRDMVDYRYGYVGAFGTREDAWEWIDRVYGRRDVGTSVLVGGRGVRPNLAGNALRGRVSP